MKYMEIFMEHIWNK